MTRSLALNLPQTYSRRSSTREARAPFEWVKEAAGTFMAWALSCAAWEGPFWRLAWALGLAGSSFFSTKSVKGWQNCWNTAGRSCPTVLMACTPAQECPPSQGRFCSGISDALDVEDWCIK